MAGKRIVIGGYMPALDLTGAPVAGAKIRFYNNGTTTLSTVYTSAALTTAHPNPVVADAAGQFPSIFADENAVFSVEITDANDLPISGLRNRDDIRPSLSFLDGVTAPVSDPIAATLTETTLPAFLNAIGAAARDLQNVVYATVTGETGVINAQYPPGDVRRYGVFPDGTTNWETDHASYVEAIKANSRLFRVHWPYDPDTGGHYATALNLDNVDNGADDTPMMFSSDPGVTFAGLLHFISSSSDLIDANVSAVSVGTTTTITLAAAHGASASHVRYVVLTGLTGTIEALNGVRVLATPQSTDQLVLNYDSTGLAYTSGGLVNDAKMTVDWVSTGELGCYNRIGAINLKGRLPILRMLSDATKDQDGTLGLGVHIYHGCEFLDIEGIIVDNTDDQNASANLHAAVALDGGGANGPRGLRCKFIEVKDSRVAGLLFSGRYDGIGPIAIRAFGNSAPLGTTAAQPADVGETDLLGTKYYNVFHGAVFGRCFGRLQSLTIDQENGFSGRAYAVVDVLFDRDHIGFTDWNTVFVETGLGMSIGYLASLNPKGTGILMAGYNQTSNHVHIDNYHIGPISTSNDFVTTPALRVARALIHQMGGKLHINNVTTGNIREACLYRSDALAATGTACNITATVGNHAAQVVNMQQGGKFHLIVERRTSGQNTEPTMVVSVPLDRQPADVRLEARNPSAVDAPLLDFDSQYGSFDVWGQDYQYSNGGALGANEATVVWRSPRCRGRVNLVTALAVRAGSAGLRLLNGVDRWHLHDSLIQGQAKGITYAGTVSNGAVTQTTMTGNTTDTDLPLSALREFYRPLLYQDHAGANQTRPAPWTSVAV